jgi:hypothetical protein
MAFFKHLCGASGHFIMLLFANWIAHRKYSANGTTIPASWRNWNYSSLWCTTVHVLQRTTDTYTTLRTKQLVSISSILGVNCIFTRKHFRKAVDFNLSEELSYPKYECWFSPVSPEGRRTLHSEVLHNVYSSKLKQISVAVVRKLTIPIERPSLSGVGIRCADHVTPSTRKGWHVYSSLCYYCN